MQDESQTAGLPRRDVYSTLYGNATSFSLTVSIILNKKWLLKQASKQKCLPPGKNPSQYISVPLQQTCRMRDLSSLTGSDPASVI